LALGRCLRRIFYPTGGCSELAQFKLPLAPIIVVVLSGTAVPQPLLMEDHGFWVSDPPPLAAGRTQGAT